MTQRTCSVEGCKRPKAVRGYCNMHYKRLRKAGMLDLLPSPDRRCSVDGCDRKHFGLGYCVMHYARFKVHGDPAVVLAKQPDNRRKPGDGPRATTCVASGCEVRPHCQDLCGKHYARLQRHGSLEHPHPRSRAPEGHHWCSQCEEYKPVDEFAANRTRTLGLADNCKSCHKRYESWQARNPEAAREWQRQWRLKNPDKVREHNRRNRLKNPDTAKRAWLRRRAAKKAAPSEDYTSIEIAERDGWRCGICGKRIGRSYRYPHPRSLSVDHIVPYAEGGTNLRVNVQASHLSCNIRKNARGSGQLRLIG